MNSDICKKALEKVGNPNILVNLISKRVRQLTGAGGGGGRPLIAETAGLGAADVALLELVEDKMAFEVLGDLPAANGETTSGGGKKRKK
jgi:DNA-directed RNA polymerase subunit omega